MKLCFKSQLSLLAIMILIINVINLPAENVVHPSSIKKAVGFAISGPLRNNPVVSYSDFLSKEIPLNRKIRPDIQPPDFSKILTDQGEQKQMGTEIITESIINNYTGQNTNLYPPDASGDVGEDYYFQVVNVTYAIYDKSDGTVVAGPSPLNSIFNSSLPGASCNSGDPIVFWDEHAGRWFYTELSHCTSNDYILIAVSTSSDPTGTWYSWSFDVDDMPDYPKFGIWQDGYYMATNTSSGNDVYVFDRTAMIAGDSNPTMIGFDNPNRPSTFDGFHCILPLDNDGPWAPSGTPGQFITIADDGQGNPADALYIYELNVDWSTPSNSTFTRTQTLNVNSFSGNFNGTWNNIPQPGTSQKLDALSTILMHRAQYRNFNGTQKIVCAHTIAESSTEAAIRWYELTNTGTNWSITQQGTYNPDNVSRWCPSIALNDNGEIAMGYSVSDGSSTYPGIRYCGQSKSAASGIMDIAEETIWTGSYSQNSYNRWGDYASMSIDPSDGTTFWFTSEYKKSATNTKGTRIASFSFVKELIVDQKLSNGTSVGNIGHWEDGPNFIPYGVPHTFYFSIGSIEALRGEQEIISNQKYHKWSLDDTVNNHRGFKITSSFTDELVSKFEPPVSGITIRNELTSSPGYNPPDDVIEFKDPWFIDYPDPNYGNVKRNRGMAAPFISRPSPFHPDFTTQYDGQEYLGVFLNQELYFPTYYSVRAPQEQTFQAHGEYFAGYFLNWEATGADLQNSDNLETPLVFRQDNAVVKAIYKGHLCTDNNLATGPNNGRRIARDSNGNLHLVYEDNHRIFYTYSTDGGDSWAPEEVVSPNDGEEHFSPSIAIMDDYIYVTWAWLLYNENSDPFWYDIWVGYKQIGDQNWDYAFPASYEYSPYKPYPSIACLHNGNDDYVIISFIQPDYELGIPVIKTFYGATPGLNFSQAPDIIGKSPSISTNSNNHYLRIAYERDYVIYTQFWYNNAWTAETNISQDAWWSVSHKNPNISSYDDWAHITWEGTDEAFPGGGSKSAIE